MSKKGEKNERTKSKAVFVSIYWIAFLGAAIIGIFGNSFFAYEAFNSLWVDVLLMLCFSALYITAFVQELFVSRKLSDVLINFFVFIVSWVLFLLMFFSDILTLLAVFYSAVMLVLISLRGVFRVRQGITPVLDLKQFISTVSLILCGMLRLMTVTFVDDFYMAWSLIPAAVICVVACVVAFILLRDFWEPFFKTKVKKITTCTLTAFLIFFAAFAYSFTAVGIANVAFDGEPVQKEYIVNDKRVQSGARQATQFKIKIEFEGKEKWIDVSVTDYHSITEGDLIVLDYYSGAFGFAYLIYAGKV